MHRTAMAVLVSALVASPVALAQTANPSSAPTPEQPQSAAQTTGATSNPNATSANNAADAKPGINASEVPLMSEEERARARTRLGVGTTMDNVPDRTAAKMRELTVDDLEDMDVYNGQGEEIGEVDEIVAGPDGKQYVIIAEGGFLGIGEDRVVLPLERFWVQGDDRLVVYGVTEDDLERLGNYRDPNYRDLEDSDKTGIPEWRQQQ